MIIIKVNIVIYGIKSFTNNLKRQSFFDKKQDSEKRLIIDDETVMDYLAKNQLKVKSGCEKSQQKNEKIKKVFQKKHEEVKVMSSNKRNLNLTISCKSKYCYS